MRLIASDPDIETILSRIDSGDINLQPEFQRGEVWGRSKKQRLIDSILRDWHVPPIHVVENPESRKQEVLDGQQRLTAIRDFMRGDFPVDGQIEPLDRKIQRLDGLHFAELPSAAARAFRQFTIRLFRIVEFEASEPAELFFRLNQPTTLTGAEQRNAFFGPVRQQIKDLVERFLGELNVDRFAFSNARMSYDDVFARTVFAIRRKTLEEKITSSDLAELYRADRPIEPETVHLLAVASGVLASATTKSPVSSLRFNKATLFSWLIFLVRQMLLDNQMLTAHQLSEYLGYFEFLHDARGHERLDDQLDKVVSAARMFAIYDARSSARVADVSSVLLRDAVIWLVFADYSRSQKLDFRVLRTKKVTRFREAFAVTKGVVLEDDVLTRRLLSAGWGTLP